MAPLAFAGVLCSQPAAAQAVDPANRNLSRQDPSWTHTGAWDYSLTGVGLATLLVEAALLQNEAQPPRWVGPILFDDAVRGVFRLTSDAGQQAAEVASWALWFPLVGYPALVDVPYAWSRYGREVAWDLVWQWATAMSLSGATDFALRDSIARVRPKNTACVEQGGAGCYSGPEVTRSFPSGHVSETTTAAALICTQHLAMRLYGGPWDGVACASAVTGDVAVAVVKLMADDHWMSDILAGAALGVAFGWGLPTLMHSRNGSRDAHSSQGMSLLVAPVPMAFASGGGLGVAGLF